MALMVREDIPNKKCWVCGQEFKDIEPFLLIKAGDDIVCLHPMCARSISREMLGDLCVLTALGYEIEDG